MGRDSSDYMTCSNCGLYEIDQCGQSAGIKEGIMSCSKHTICIDCFPEAFEKNKELLLRFVYG